MLFKIKIFVENIFLYIYIYICFNLSEAQTIMPYKKLINYREEWHQKKKKNISNCSLQPYCRDQYLTPDFI